MVNNIRNKVAANKLLSLSCYGLYDEAYNGNPLYNAWANPIYFNSTIKKPVHIDSDIWGLEAGFDIQQNIYHKIGVFASYRKGDYDLNGDGKKLYSPIGSNIDINSYLGGLYYRYDRNNLWAFATIYGGIQQADIKTNDGVSSDTDGNQMGASLELGKIFALNKTVSLEPSLGVNYTQVDFDNTNDSMGKTALYDTIRQTELEAGVKLEKTIYLKAGAAKFYFKPSVIQTITSGDSVYINGLGNVSTYDDETLGRGEIGAKISLTEELSGYGFASYSFGSNYDASSFGIGINYAW